MIIGVISSFDKGEEFKVNEKGYDELEIDPINDITAFTINNKQMRMIGIQSNLYRLSLKSYKELKKYLQKNNNCRYVKV